MADVIKNLVGFDLNLLRVFAAINESRHVTKAAQTLGMTQSALSHALNRLRQLLDDPLFVKSSGGMVPTPKAEALAKPINEMLGIFGRAILETSDFNPQSLERAFKVRTTDLIETLLLPKLLNTFEKEAPYARIICQTAGFSLPRRELELGACDLAIAGFFGDLPDGFYQQKLFTETFLCAVRKKHPRLKDKRQVSLDEYCKERHLLIAPGGDFKTRMDAILKQKKKEKFVVAGVSSFMASGWIAAEGDNILTGPSRLIKTLANTFSLEILRPPVDIPSITIVQAWHERNHADAAHRWFRDHIKSILQEPL